MIHATSPELQTAISLWQQGKADDALTMLDNLASRPELAAQVRLAQSHIQHSLKKHGEALTSIMQAIRLDPALAEAWEFAGYLLVSRKRWQEACNLLGMAVEAFPTRASMRAHYALALDKTGQMETAYRQVNQVLDQFPTMIEALLARIEILFDAGYFDLALQDSLQLENKGIPETATFCHGAAAFLTGDAQSGMRLLASVTKSGWHGADLPEWDGEPDLAKHVVIYNGQGFGDLIQFARYIEAARHKAGSLTLQIPRTMERLMRDSFPDLPLLIETEEMVLPDHITHRCSLMSLAVTPSGFDPLGATVPYLRHDPQLATNWREKLAPIPRPWIGVVWMSPWQLNSPFRVVDFPVLQPLIDVAGQHLISLQMGPEAKQANDAGLLDASPHIKDFADTAALMAELDLVITLDSAPAHLAGALGRPVWTFLPFSAEWRWLVEREDCIWYPSMRLFRQAQPQGWAEVFQTMRDQLERFLSGDRSVLQPPTWHKTAPQRHPHAFSLPDLKTT